MKFILPLFSGILLSTAAIAQTTVLNEDFETGVPSSWTIRKVDTNHADTSVYEFAAGWIGLEDPQDNTNHIAGATSFFDPVGSANRWLISPSIALGTYGNILSWKGRSHDPSFAENYMVLISTTDTEVASFTDTLKLVVLEEETWVDHEINLSEQGYNSGNVHIAFVLRTYDGFKLYLDDFNVRKDDPVGLNELSEIDVNLYPNPVKTTFRIDTEVPAAVSLYSSTGQLVFTAAEVTNNAVDISHLPAGTYIGLIQTAEGSARKRIVKL